MKKRLILATALFSLGLVARQQHNQPTHRFQQRRVIILPLPWLNKIKKL